MTAAWRGWMLKGLLLLIAIAWLPWAEDPFRLPREGLFQLAGVGVLLLWLYGRLFESGNEPPAPRGAKQELILFALALAALAASALATGGGYAAALNVALAGALYLGFRQSLTKENARGWALLFFIPAGLNALLGIAQYAGIDPFFKSLDPAFHSIYRRYLVAGFMDSPNMLAPFLASFVPLAWAFFMRERGAKAAFWGGAALLLLAPIALTRNIGGITPLAAVMGLLLLYYTARAARGERGVARLAASWLVALLALGAAWNAYSQQDETTKILKRYSIDERRTQNEACLMMFRDAPLLGKGPGFFYRHFVEYRRAVWFGHPPLRLPDRVAHQAHNDYLQLLAEGGLLAALPFAALLLLWLYRHGAALWRAGAADERLPLLAGGIGGFWVIALNGIGSFPFHIAALAAAALFWGALAAVMVECGTHE